MILLNCFKFYVLTFENKGDAIFFQNKAQFTVETLVLNQRANTRDCLGLMIHVKSLKLVNLAFFFFPENNSENKPHKNHSDIIFLSLALIFSQMD